MASLSFARFLSPPRCHSNWQYCSSVNLLHTQNFRLQSKWHLAATSRKNIVETLAQEELNDNEVVVKKKTSRTSKRATTKESRKKSETDALETNSDLEINRDASDEESVLPTSSEDTKKNP